MSRPRLLMVDEPFLGLAPGVVKEMMEAAESLVVMEEMDLLVVEEVLLMIVLVAH